MFEFISPEIKNIKLHFRVKNKIDHNNIPNCYKLRKQCGNYFTIQDKHSKTTYSIFNSGFVNATGFRNQSSVLPAIEKFNIQFGFNITENEVHTDNITASGTIEAIPRFDLSEIKKTIDLDADFKNIKTSLQPRFFPALILRFAELPTVLFFASGRYTIVGSKNLENIKKAFESLCAIISRNHTRTLYMVT